MLLEPTLTTLGNFLVRSNSQSSVALASFTVGGFQLEGYAMTLSAFAWNIARPTTTARLDFLAPPGGIAKLHFGAFGGSIPGLVQQSACTACRFRASAFKGESVPVADSLALTLDGLTAQNNVGCDVNCTDVFTTGVDASGAVSCAALTATGTVAGATLTSTGAVSGSLSTTANTRNFTTVGDVSTGTGAATAAAHGHHADHHRGGLRGPAGLQEPGLHLHGHKRRSVDGQRGLRRRDELGHGLRAAALRLTKNWAGWSKLQVSNNSAAPGCWEQDGGTLRLGSPQTTSQEQRAVGGVQGLPGPAGQGGSLAGSAEAEEQVKNGAFSLF